MVGAAQLLSAGAGPSCWGGAGQTGLALERARLYEETRDVALSLQRSLLAGAPPPDPRFEVATLYHPAIEHLEVGGGLA
jgi:hypothetical protein